jgi:hypothetical protein
LLNIMFQMASKRGEVDAAKGLPGVGSALRRLFKGKMQRGQAKPPARPTEEGPNWTSFWGEVNRLGLTPERAHEILGVKSIKDDWLASGRTLEAAIDCLRQAVGEAYPPAGEERDPETIKSRKEFEDACLADFRLPAKEAWRLTGMSPQDSANWGQLYLEVKAKR